MKVLIDISEDDYEKLRAMQAAGFGGHYHELILKGAKLQDNPNNGEVLNAVFPDANIYHRETLDKIGLKIDIEVGMDWANAPYGRVVIK